MIVLSSDSSVRPLESRLTTSVTVAGVATRSPSNSTATVAPVAGFCRVTFSFSLTLSSAPVCGSTQ